MTAAFAAIVAVCIAVTKADPFWGVIFAAAATLISNFKFISRLTPLGIPLLLAFCGLTLPFRQTALIYLCCMITASIKKNYYYSIPLLLAVAAAISFFSASEGGESKYSYIGLLLLLPCAAGCPPKDKIKGLCIGLAVSLPIMFGCGRTAAIALLLPALIPVLTKGGRCIQSFREG